MGNDVPPDTSDFKVRGRGFVPGEPYILFYGHYFQTGDINGDNYDDLLLSSRVQTIPPNPQDSLDVLHIYLGSPNFTFLENGETLRYESRLKNDVYSYGWFKRELSVMDINGDSYSDLIISHLYKDATNHVHYGAVNGIDTIPSFFITDPDTTREYVVVGPMCHDVGDWNNDGDGDFLLKPSYFKSFTLHLGGPHINNINPYGMKGLLESCYNYFPNKAINCGDQNGDGIKDFVVIATCGLSNNGFVIIYKGRDDIVVGIANEKEVIYLTDNYLEQNYPNPFNTTTMIRYGLRFNAGVKITVYDLLGKEIAVLVNEEKQTGEYEIEFDASKYNLSSGTYFYKIKTDGNGISRKMIYLK